MEYLGHLINEKGLHPTPSKVKAVTDARTPHNVSELKSFLGLMNYYSKFIPNCSIILSPLYSLLQKNSRWTWNFTEDDCFKQTKELLTSPQLLVHYNPNKKILLSTDASSYGIGAVLTQQMEDGSEQPIGIASRTLSPAEKKYSQLDKQALTIIFGVTRFHQYVYGRHFTLYTDHKPLTHLFHPSKSIPQMASTRIQRWSLTLNAYSYTILYCSGKSNGNADSLSRLPLPKSLVDVPTPGDVLLTMTKINKSPICSTDIKAWTLKDPLFSKVLRYITRGWLLSTEDEQ